MLVKGALNSYSSIFNTNIPHKDTIDKIINGITLPANLLNDAMQIYNNTAKYLTIEQVKNILYRFFTDSLSVTIPKIENPGKSTTTFSGVNEENKVEFKKEVEKIKKIIAEAINQVGDITTQVGKESAIHTVIKALEKAGYSLAATTLRGIMRIDLTGAFNAISLSNPTDVAKLLRQQGEEFIYEKKMEIFRIDPKLNPGWNFDTKKEASLRIEISVRQAIEDYLTNKIKYYDPNTPIGNKLVFPEVKFDFMMRSDYWVEEVRLKP